MSVLVGVVANDDLSGILVVWLGSRFCQYDGVCVSNIVVVVVVVLLL